MQSKGCGSETATLIGTSSHTSKAAAMSNKETKASSASTQGKQTSPGKSTQDEPELIKTESDPETVAPAKVEIIARRNGNVNFKLEDLLPDSGEELLGSVTFAPIRSSSSTNQGPVRTSARVIQKMRQDNRPSTPPATVAPTDAKPEKAPSAPKTPTQAKQPLTTKKLWSNHERTLFFEALNEYGKDFDAIAQHINQKMRRKVVGSETATPPSKSREQIRQMYLQTLHKAGKYLRFSEDVKKVAQELYAVINYGELRRKMPFMHEKALMKLKELVYRGSVTIRDKGKTVRIKTPSCRALKKLNQLEEWQEEVTLPQRIEINLVPATMESWGRVQGLAQNPRIKTSLPLHKRVSSLLKFLQHKWRSQEMRLCEKTMTFQPVTSGRAKNSQRNLNIPQMPVLDNQELIDELKNKEPLLCFAPPAKTIIHRPMVNLTDFSNSYSICLNSYEERIGAKCRGEELPVEKFLTHKERMMNGKRLRLDSGGESGTTGGASAGKKGNVSEKRSKVVELGQQSNSDGEAKSETECVAAQPSATEAATTTSMGMEGVVVQSEDEMATALDIQMFDFSVIAEPEEAMVMSGADRIDLFSDNSEDKKMQCKSEEESVEPDTSMEVVVQKVSTSKRGKGEGRGGNRTASFKPLISEEMIRKIKEGWTLKTCGDLTFGDLYVMFGNEFKINLEYRWTDKERTDGQEEKVKEEVSDSTKTQSQTEIESVADVDKNMEQLLGRRLSQLLMVANLMDKNKKKECTCDRGGKMKENDYPYPESNLFKHPAQPPLRYSHYNGFNSMLQMRRLKPRQVYPFMNPKPYTTAPNQYHSGRMNIPRPLPTSYDEAGDGDAEDDGDEGTSSSSSSTARRNGDKSKEEEKIAKETNSSPEQVIAVQTENTATEVTSTTTVDMVAAKSRAETDEEDDETEGDDEDDAEDYSKNPGILSLLDISLPSIRGGEESRGDVVNRQGWLEDNMNDYSFSSLLGHIDMHLNSSGRDSDSVSVESSPGKRMTGTAGMSTSSSSMTLLRNEMSDRCSIISETSVDFVNKFAELTEMIQDR